MLNVSCTIYRDVTRDDITRETDHKRSQKEVKQKYYVTNREKGGKDKDDSKRVHESGRQMNFGIHYKRIRPTYTHRKPPRPRGTKCLYSSPS